MQKLITEAEEGITLLRAKLASSSSSSSLSNSLVKNGVGANRAGGGGGVQAGAGAPTVEAVVNTIMKMTSMAEKKSGDVDVLENQMRRLGIDHNGSGRTSRHASPFGTSSQLLLPAPHPRPGSSSSSTNNPPPPRTPSSSRVPLASSVSSISSSSNNRGNRYAVFYTPDNSTSSTHSTPAAATRLGGSLQASLSVSNNNGVSTPSLDRIREKVAGRREVAGKLREVVLAKGPKVRGMGMGD